MESDNVQPQVEGRVSGADIARYVSEQFAEGIYDPDRIVVMKAGEGLYAVRAFDADGNYEGFFIYLPGTS